MYSIVLISRCNNTNNLPSLGLLMSSYTLGLAHPYSFQVLHTYMLAGGDGEGGDGNGDRHGMHGLLISQRDTGGVGVGAHWGTFRAPLDCPRRYDVSECGT